MKFLLSLLFVFSSLTIFAQDCSIMKSGIFRDAEDFDKTAYIEIDNDYLYDYAKNESEYILSKIHWVNDCTYVLTLVETNIEDFELPMGTRLKVNILETKGNVITYQYASAGNVLKPRTLIKYESLNEMKLAQDKPLHEALD